MENKLFFERAFNSFEEALDRYLESNDEQATNKEIAERLIRKFGSEKKESSWAVQIGQWRNRERKARPHNIEKINEVLNVRFFKNQKTGKWHIIDKNSPIAQKIDRVKSLLGNNGISDKDVDEILLTIRGRALSLSKDLEGFADWLQRLRSDS